MDTTTTTDSKGWGAFILSSDAKEYLLKTFPPKFEKSSYSHITFGYGISMPDPIPVANNINIVGYASNDVIEAVVVSVDGNTAREFGGLYHVTLSYNSSKAVPADSNQLLSNGFTRFSPVNLMKNPKFKFVELKK